MLVAVVCLPSPNAGEWAGQRLDRLNFTQTLGLANYIGNRTRLDVCVICQQDTELEDKCGQLKIPHLPVSAKNGLYRLFKLWRWQNTIPNLHILAIGDPAMNLGITLKKIRHDPATSLNFAFFLNPPPGDAKTAKKLANARTCFCGTRQIADKVENIFGRTENLEIVAPGMELKNYRLADPDKNYDANNHFCFAMAESLLPHSGALLVIRAMAALWQREQLPPWEVRMFGGGPRFHEILVEAENLGVSSRLSILSSQPLSIVAGMCDCWLAPGSSPHELPSTLWGGIAAGLPLVSADTPLHAERLPVDAPVMKIEENNPQNLARVMISIMEDRALRKRLVEGMAPFRTGIGLDHMAKKICGKIAPGMEKKDAELDPAPEY